VIPYHLMTERCDIYTGVVDKDETGRARTTYTLAQSNVPCSFQQTGGSVDKPHLKRSHNAPYWLFLVSKSAYDLINENSKIKVAGVEYSMVNKTNLSNKSKVYQIDITDKHQ